MAYLNNIPQPTDQLSQSQADILNNFQILNPFGNYWALFQILAMAPGTAANQLAMYAETSAITGTNELSIQRSDGSLVEFTSYQGNHNVNGWTRLPSNILLKWGFSAAIPVPGGLGVALNTTGPNFVNTFVAFAVGSAAGGLNPVFVNALSNLNLGLVSTGTGNSGAYWLVIGV